MDVCLKNRQKCKDYFLWLHSGVSEVAQHQDLQSRGRLSSGERPSCV